jgi:hypothetical protein
MAEQNILKRKAENSCEEPPMKQFKDTKANKITTKSSIMIDLTNDDSNELREFRKKKLTCAARRLYDSLTANFVKVRETDIPFMMCIIDGLYTVNYMNASPVSHWFNCNPSKKEGIALFGADREAEESRIFVSIDRKKIPKFSPGESATVQLFVVCVFNKN